MELVKPGTYIDFMRYRKAVISSSLLLVTASIVSLFFPGPNYGIDFQGGTELQLAFQGDVSAGDLRQALEGAGYMRPDVVSVQDSENEFIIRVQEVSALPEGQIESIRTTLEERLGSVSLNDMQVSPGGDKIAFRLGGTVEPQLLEEALTESGVGVRGVNAFGQAEDFRYEAHLVGVADEIVRQLRETLGERGPADPRRVEWVGPKAGA
ncbi:MAG: hypothetical protein JRH11_27745, partial [Deltaproteobacteria bacterium]|nr:hypothetical protein [Deltaproteobacteria bacterium]